MGRAGRRADPTGDGGALIQERPVQLLILPLLSVARISSDRDVLQRLRTTREYPSLD